jgi:hypothetical protein
VEQDEMLVKLRPTINTIENNAQTSDIELFQNQVLRPILKLQHDRLMMLFDMFLSEQKNNFNQLKLDEKEKYITNLLQKQVAFRNQVVGCTIGLFTFNEFSQYASNKVTINRRILNLAKQRILSAYKNNTVH